jgi:hypothetical protein
MADTNLLVLAREYKKLREEVKKVLSMPKGDKGDQGEKGEKGDTGDTGPQGFPGRDGKDGINGYDGKEGRDGVDGKDGKDGLDGVGVANAYIDFDNSLVIVLTDGREVNAGFLSQETKDNVVATFKQGAATINELLPPQAGNANKFLKTDGTDVSWDTLDGSDINLSSPPVIGNVTPNAGTFTTLTAQTARLNGTGSNLLNWSSDWTQGVSNFAVTVTLASGTAPDSTNTANRFVGTNSTALHARTKSVTVAANVTSVFSIYLKKLDKQYIQLGLDDGNTNGAHVNIDLDAVAAVSTPVTRGSGTGYSVSVTSLPSGWMRVALVGDPASNAGTLRVAVVQIDSSGAGWTASSVGNGTSGYYIWGAQLEINSAVSAYIATTSLPTYGTPTLSFSGVASIGLQSDGSLYETSAGTGNVRFYTNNISQEQFRVSHTASAVNFVQVTGAATGAGPIISAQGSDSNAELRYRTRGIFNHLFQNGNGNTNFSIDQTSGNSVVNRLQVAGSVASSAPVLSSVGSDTNIDLALTPKGTGLVRFGTYTANMALTVQGYVEIKDAGGTTRRLAVVA